MSISIKEAVDKRGLDTYGILPIGPIGIKTNNPIGPIGATENTVKYKIVNFLLEECSDLIDSRYKRWFAKQFYMTDKTLVMRYASEARQEGKNPQALFVYKLRGQL